MLVTLSVYGRQPGWMLMAEFRLVESFRITRARPVPGLGTGPYSEPLDITVVGGVITAIEPTAGVGDGDFDADGANLMPGLWDNHVHFSLASLIGQCTRLSHKAAQAEILAAATTDRLWFPVSNLARSPGSGRPRRYHRRHPGRVDLP